MGYLDETGLAEFTTKIKDYLQSKLTPTPPEPTGLIAYATAQAGVTYTNVNDNPPSEAQPAILGYSTSLDSVIRLNIYVDKNGLEPSVDITSNFDAPVVENLGKLCLCHRRLYSKLANIFSYNFSQILHKPASFSWYF